ncbi:helix-hairpin-helix domain-containing protein [Marimonas sp. MJW-29]|uniref:Helix-hairpin-helix domain-containing protein n=1 Tax=Sulfitobacter sediminis TaxID=3234186 RepID=A0ABV3RKA1_9RHOB
MAPAPQSRSDPLAENLYISDQLIAVAELLVQQEASPFRLRAYREAAEYLGGMPHPVREVYEAHGRRGLEDLPTIGVSIAAAIAEILENGTLSLLDRLRGRADPEKLLQTVPMIGPSLAHTIHETLHIDTLEALEAAAVDGRLGAIRGIGPRRVESIRHSLNDMLRRRRPRAAPAEAPSPPISDLLSVDAEYRERAVDLPTIRPRRFNEDGQNRIPILHTERGPWHFTALFSNTATAHQYGMTRDWVVIYFERDHAPEGQCTVVTERGGPLDGRRVVRGREAACAAHYSA